MRVGLLGAGRIGALHAETLTAHEKLSELMIYDVDGERSKSLADSHDVANATSVDALMTWADAVVIATSTDTHADLLFAAARKGKPAFCEKPIANSLETTDHAIEAIRAAGIPVQIGFNRRFDNGFLAARRAVESGSLGTLLSVVGHHHDHVPPPLDYIPLSGGQFRDQLIHDFDLLRFVTGEEAVDIYAAGTSVGLPIFSDYDDSSAALVTLTMESGALAVLVGARTDPIGYDVRMELFGTDDSIAVGLDRRTPLRSMEDGMDSPEDPYKEWLSRFGDSYRREMDVFLSVAVDERESPCTPIDARAALVLAEAATLSAREHRTVSVTELDRAGV